VFIAACGIAGIHPQQKAQYSLDELVALGLQHNPIMAASSLEVAAKEVNTRLRRTRLAEETLAIFSTGLLTSTLVTLIVLPLVYESLKQRFTK